MAGRPQRASPLVRSILAAGISLAVLAVMAAGGLALWQEPSPAREMTRAAAAFLQTLDEQQKAKVLLPYQTPQRLDWHFIPKAERKGLQVKDMSPEQRQAAAQLLRAALSAQGLRKAQQIMRLEAVLHELEKERRRGPIRDPERYYLTLFGQVEEGKRWGMSFEGHHLSLNFVVEGEAVISNTPSAFCANPAVVKNAVVDDVPVGTRVLAQEELLALELVQSLDNDQRSKAVIARESLREVRAPGSPQPPQEPPAGISYAELNEEQKELLRRLVITYARNFPDEVARQRLREIRDAGPEKVHFAWAGALKEGEPHYYRIQGPTFLIEFVNSQPDAAGNPANHIHTVWRDMRGDFAIPIQPGTP